MFFVYFTWLSRRALFFDIGSDVLAPFGLQHFKQLHFSEQGRPLMRHLQRIFFFDSLQLSTALLGFRPQEHLMSSIISAGAGTLHRPLHLHSSLHADSLFRHGQVIEHKLSPKSQLQAIPMYIGKSTYQNVDKNVAKNDSLSRQSKIVQVNIILGGVLGLVIGLG